MLLKPARSLWLLVTLFLVALTGCLQQPAERETEVTFAEAMAFEPIGRGQHASLDTLEATEVAIRSKEAWSAYQDSLRPLQPFDSVNFAQEMVVLVAVPVTSGGYGIEFDTVERSNDSLLVHYRLSTPGYDCMSGLSKGIVFQAIRVARFDQPIRFEQETEAYRCTPDKSVF